MNLYKEYAKEFSDAGYSVIPDKYMSKQPAIKGWTNYCSNKPTSQEIENWSNTFSKSNVAVCLGKASGIVAIDLDCVDPEIVKIVERIVRPTKIEKVGSNSTFFWFPIVSNE